MGRISGDLRESMANAQAFKEAEKERIRKIQHYANSDMEGRPCDEHYIYNLTQQSSEGPFMSTMQMDRSWLSVLFSVFRNSSMAYQRQLHDAVRNPLCRRVTYL